MKRILVDTRSSSNILTLKALHRMGMGQEDQVPTTMDIAGFSGEVQRSVGEIMLPTKAKGVNLQTPFVVIYFPSAYNVIMGRLGIHNMGAISLTYHQVIKSPTTWGIQEIRGDQAMAKECYKIAMKALKSATVAVTPE